MSKTTDINSLVYVPKSKEKLNNVLKVAHENLKLSTTKIKIKYDIYTKRKYFITGDYVLVFLLALKNHL